MTKDSDSKDLFDFELPGGLDDDLGGDWESAFQAEDFMLSPEDEAEVFLEKEGGSSQGAELEDLASLLVSDEPKAKEPSVATADREKTLTPRAEKRIAPPSSVLPTVLAAWLAASAGWLAAAAAWLKRLPVYQKILFPGLALGAVLFLGALLFFLSTTRQLAEQPPAAEQTVAAKAPQGNQVEPAASVVPQEPIMQAEHTPSPGKNRKKWPMPGFFIAVPQGNGLESVLVRIDLSLVLLLEPGSTIPEEKRPIVRNTIFQFFANRPPEELRRYALARGEMIQNLQSWLQQEWPQNPISTIMFDRYQVLN
jgi:hypothetical protein